MTALRTALTSKVEVTTQSSISLDLSSIASGDGVILWATINFGTADDPGLALAAAAGDHDPTAWTLIVTDPADNNPGGWRYCGYSGWFIDPGGTIPASVTVTAAYDGAMVLTAVPVDPAQVASPMFGTAGLRAGGDALPAVDAPSLSVSAGSEFVVLYAGEDAGDLTWESPMTEHARDAAWTGSSNTSVQAAVGSETRPTAGATGTRTVDPANGVDSARMYAISVELLGASATEAPTGWTFTKTVDTAEVTGSWTAVTGATSYDYEVEEWDGSAWQAFAVSSVTAPTTTFTLTDADGVQFNTLYRARVRTVEAA